MSRPSATSDNVGTNAATASSGLQTQAAERLVSIDALRGFDMFWIIGADEVAHALQKANSSEVVQVIGQQLDHVAWEGFRFYDLIFPLFVFVIGVSSVFSLSRLQDKYGQATAYRRVIVRSLLLYLLGLFYYGALRRDDGPEMFRYVGVLQRLAICYLGGSLLFLNLRVRGLLTALVVLLVGYWAMLALIPVPGTGAGNFAEGQNLTNWFDANYLPGYKWDGQWDPEGVLSHIPAIGTAILGLLAGIILHRKDFAPWRKVGLLVAAGAACLLLGWAWSIPFPMIKKLWTSSYVLIAGGCSFLLMAIFYIVIDIWSFRFWARPFVWIGMNAITIYMLTHLIDFKDLVRRVLHEQWVDAMAPYGQTVVTSLALLLAVLVCRWLYRRQIFLRL
ncbi:MAG: hypothetical protein R3E01_08660 [Pirellulaceae bacterium]